MNSDEPTPNPMTNLVAALALGQKGWQILPLDGKVPAVAGGRGVLDATSDPAQIRSWWTRYPSANIGARVPRGLLVIDVDPRNGGDLAALEAGNAPLPETLGCWSGREDGGRHLYYRGAGGPISSRRLPAGIDVKTSSGYCVVPPSLHPVTGVAYRWEQHPIAVLPSWLRMLLRPITVLPRTGTFTNPSSGSGLVRFVERLPEGNRNKGLFWAACRAVDAGNFAQLDNLRVAGERTGLSASKVAATIASARAKRSRP